MWINGLFIMGEQLFNTLWISLLVNPFDASAFEIYFEEYGKETIANVINPNPNNIACGVVKFFIIISLSKNVCGRKT